MMTDENEETPVKKFVPAASYEALKKDFQSFAYIVSHDLNVPLRHIREFTEILLSDLEPHIGGETREIADTILRKVDSAENMVECLVQYSRLNTRIQSFERINTTVLMTSVLNTLDHDIRRVGGDVQVGELPDVVGDERQISQLLHCLIDNAIKFRRQDVPLKIAIVGAQGDQDSIITIEDNGLGIPENRLEKIFELFYRHHVAGNDGSGLGLALCKKIVGLHGGSIKLESVVDEGSHFIVSMPKLN